MAHPKTDAASENHNLAVSVGKNTVFGVVARIAQVATRLVTIPFVIAHLGLGGYGIWGIIMTAGAYMRFGSVGIKSAFQKYVAEATGNGDYETANKLLSTGTAAMAILSVVGLVPICIFSHRLAQMAGVPPEFLDSSAGAISMLALIMMLSNVGAAFEAIVMGGHRIDLARKFTTVFTVLEAIAIIILLHFGHGLFAMAAVMGLSELGFIASCYVAARKVVPQIHVNQRYITFSVLPELFRYAGSYQLVNILEVVYGAVVPVALLRVFGAESAGVYALVTRLISSAGMLPDAFLLPILSAGAKVYSSGSSEDMQRLIAKSVKVTLVLTLFPLGFFAIFGPIVLYAWTATTNPAFRVALLIVGLCGVFQSMSILGLVLYRVSGRAVLDNIRQVLRIVTVLSVGLFAKRLGFYGVLEGLAVAELIGMLFMTWAMKVTFPGFHLRNLLKDATRLSAATAAILGVAYLAAQLPVPIAAGPRIIASVRLGFACLGCLVAAWPALYLTRAITAGEGQALIRTILPGKFRGIPAVAPNTGEAA